MKQNIIFKLFLILLAVILVGCGRTEDASSSESSTNEADESEETSDRTHGEYESSDIESVVPDISEPEVSVPEESQDESDRTHGEYESESETSDSAASESEESSSDESEVESSEPIESEPEVHTCSFAAKKTVEPTCTADGYTVYKCECGESENRDTVYALGHSAGDWVTITEATTDVVGLKRKSCTRCGTTVSEEEIPKISVNDDSMYDVEPSAKYDVPDTIDNIKLLEERTLYYLNQYRLQDGVQEVTALLNGKTYKYAKMRAEQLVDNFAHDTQDIRSINNMLEFGEYHPEAPEYYYDWETDTLIETGNMTPAYYAGGCSEAITKGYGQYTTVDSVARKIALNCYNSDAHWSYVGASTTVHITVGAYQLWDEWFICVATSGSAEYD